MGSSGPGGSSLGRTAGGGTTSALALASVFEAGSSSPENASTITVNASTIPTTPNSPTSSREPERGDISSCRSVSGAAGGPG